MMNCNGKTYPLLSNCKFDMIIFGNKSKGKIIVNAVYGKDKSAWDIKSMAIQTLGRESINIL